MSALTGFPNKLPDAAMIVKRQSLTESFWRC